jgi:ABC-type glycerol-3-phosphate transport system substrate-binding protein
MIAGGHIMGIPQDIPESQKEAAFYAILRTAHPDYSNHYVVDAYTGMDPFLEEHYSEEVAENATKPNPRRGTAERYPENVPIAESVEEAYQIYLTGHEENMKIAFPKPVWPGASQYIEALNTRLKQALSGQIGPQEALDKAANEWQTILSELGPDQQQAAYQQYLSKARDLDLI